ncbi:MAG: hypothetical protein ACREH8_19350 [Opitutaceae bacterium]
MNTADLERQILRAVRTSASKPVEARDTFSKQAWSVVGLGAVAAVATVFVSVNPTSTPSSREERIDPATAQESAVIINTVESVSTQLVDTVIPAAGGLVAKNPLQEELGLVYSDVRSALDFLALNFLPAAAAPASAAPQPTRQI